MIKNKITYIMNYDILERLISFYHNIPSLYKTSFWTTFIILNIVFAFHTINFLWGNHEWYYIYHSIPWDVDWYQARFTNMIPLSLIGFNLLPILLNLFGFAGIALSGLTLAIYLKIPQKKTSYICFCLVYALLPYNLCWLYHILDTSNFYGCFIITSALLLFENKRNSRFFLLWNIVIILMLFFVIGFHAAFLNTIFILVIGRCLIDFIQNKSLKNLIYEGLILLFDIICAALLLKSAMLAADHYNILNTNYYNIQTISFSDIPLKFLTVMKYSLEQFTKSYPFIDQTFLILLLIMTGFALISTLCIVIKKRGIIIGTTFYILTLSALLFATQLAIFISDNQLNYQFLFRLTGYFSLYYFFILMLAFLFNFWQKQWLKNILFFISLSVFSLSVYNDMYAMRVWKLSRDTEEKIMQRIIARIENSNGFSYEKKYKMVILGDMSLRYKYYNFAKYHNTADTTTLSWSFRAFWNYMAYFNFQFPGKLIINDFDTEDGGVFELIPHLPKKTLRFILKEGNSWPEKNSVFIKDDYIFLFMSKYELQEFKQKIKEYLNL